jgi:hypothetical protein
VTAEVASKSPRKAIREAHTPRQRREDQPTDAAVLSRDVDWRRCGGISARRALSPAPTTICV